MSTTMIVCLIIIGICTIVIIASTIICNNAYRKIRSATKIKENKSKLRPDVKALILCVSLLLVFWTLYFINCNTLENKIIECSLMFCIWTTAIFSNKFENLFK